jgi:hypothetical protein
MPALRAGAIRLCCSGPAGRFPKQPGLNEAGNNGHPYSDWAGDPLAVSAPVGPVSWKRPGLNEAGYNGAIRLPIGQAVPPCCSRSRWVRSSETRRPARRLQWSHPFSDWAAVRLVVPAPWGGFRNAAPPRRAGYNVIHPFSDGLAVPPCCSRPGGRFPEQPRPQRGGYNGSIFFVGLAVPLAVAGPAGPVSETAPASARPLQ